MKVSFEVSAKAARLIGRENIADVDGALVELIKNAYDADATCVYVGFFVPFPAAPTVVELSKMSELLSEKDYKEVTEEYYEMSKRGTIRRKDNLTDEEKQRLERILFSYNRIIVADNGDGMTRDVVLSSWMQIATSDKENNHKSAKGRIKTGAKGIGRFALDKLSRHSIMYTKGASQGALRWEIDWDQFSSSKLLSEVQADIGEAEASYADQVKSCIGDDYQNLSDYKWETGTMFILSPTREAWSSRLFEKVNTNLKSINPLGSADEFKVIVKNHFFPQHSYETEQVAIDDKDYDYKITAYYDGCDQLKIGIHRNEFIASEKSVVIAVGQESGEFDLAGFWARDHFSNAPYTKEDYCFGASHIELNIEDVIKTEDYDKVRAVGPFSAEFYFVKNGKSDFPFVKDVPTLKRKRLLSRFSGIKLYRDNFKVRPYGDEGSLYDWLNLNERANRSPAGVSHQSGAWRVLPYQMIGVVKIGRVENASLYDTANREGLTQNDSYFFFVKLLQEAITRFEFDRQYIYREYAKWVEDCKSTLTSAAKKIIDEVRSEDAKKKASGSEKKHRETEKERDNQPDRPPYSEQDYRDALGLLIASADQEQRAKQTVEVLSSAGVILNTFFHEFRGVHTSLKTRSSQLRLRIDNILNGQPYSGPAFLDPYQKLDYFDATDRLLAGWLKVVMDAVSADKFIVEPLSLLDELSVIVDIWKQLLAEKMVSLTINSMAPDNSYVINSSRVDLYVVINNFLLNSVYFFEKGDQPTREIVFSIDEQTEHITLTMENNGPPLDEKYRAQPMIIFELGESSKEGGTGLGLWLMRDAVERTDGQVSLLNRETGFAIQIKWRKQTK